MYPITLLWIFGYAALILAVFFKFFTWNFNYFIEQGIHGPSPIPIFGNCWRIWKKHWHRLEIQRYQKYGRIYGTFEGRTPNFVIGDPKLIRKILVDDSKHFENRGQPSSNSKYLEYLLPALRGKQWSSLRTTVSPVFSTDSMAPLIETNAKELTNFLKHRLTSGIKKIDMEKVATAFAIDAMASIAFGTKVDAMSNPDSRFVQELTATFSQNISKRPEFILGQIYPTFGKLISNSNGFEFFAHFAKVVLKERRQQDPETKKRGDFVDFLLEEDTKLNEDQLVAQMLQFLITGIEPVATAIACGINCLALNPEIQQKLRLEIRGAMHEGNLDMISIRNLPYLDQCISETLRLFPPALRLERQCNRTVNYEGAKIRKGTLVTIPIYAIHHDPELYPQPDLFDPDRFSHKEKSKRDPETFLPFGAGNRACIASSLATQQIKIAVAQLVTEFRFIRVFETSDPPHFRAGGFPPTLQPKTVIVGISEKF